MEVMEVTKCMEVDLDIQEVVMGINLTILIDVDRMMCLILHKNMNNKALMID